MGCRPFECQGAMLGHQRTMHTTLSKADHGSFWLSKPHVIRISFSVEVEVWYGMLRRLCYGHLETTPCPLVS